MFNKHIIGASLIAASLAAASGAWAADQTGTMAPGATMSGGAPASGANSFTEGEAKARITKAGYSDVSALKQDDKGVWRGTASKDGKSVPVALDFQGNVVSQ